jgi:hypothetical protein
MFRAGPLLLALLALTLAAQTALAQQAAVSVRGRVVDAENDRPLRRTIVSLARGDRSKRPVLTDEEGRFEIELPNATSALVIGKAGYASTIVEPDRRTVPSRELDIRLPRGAAMSGHVVERGGPAIGARVIARRVEDASNSAPTYEAETDELGEYRIGGLPAGHYTVAAAPTPQGIQIEMSGREAVQGIVSRRLTVFPGLTAGLTGSTRLVEVRAGEETVDVDFATEPVPLPPRAPAATAAFLKSNEQDPGAIAGRVVTPLGQPVGGALVMISGNNQSRMVMADADGQFDAGRFKYGDYQIQTGRSGYLTPDPRVPPDGGTARTVHIGADTRVHDLELVLARGSAVTGTIVDSAGEPFQGVLVRALRLRQDNGRMIASGAALPRLTDDRGRYRVFGLLPGAYLIVASLDATERASGRSRAPGFAPVYYPGTAHVESAQTVQVELNGVAAGVDFTFAVSSTVRVTGTAVNAAGSALTGRVALGVSQRAGSVAAEPRFAQIQHDGSFELADIPPGDYILQALGDRAPGVPPEFGSEYITVGETDPPPLEIKTTPGATLEGRFVAESRSILPMRAQSIHAAPMDVDRSPGGRGPEGLAVHDDGRFYLTGLYGSMRLTYPAPSGWYLKSVTIRGVDVTDAPFDFGFGDDIFPDAEIVLSNAGATIAGSIEDGPGRTGTTFNVVVFSTSRTDWFPGSRYVKRGSSAANASFEISGLPPGEYFVAAVSALPPGDWQSPETLDALVPLATRVSVREGQMRSIDLRVNRR